MIHNDVFGHVPIPSLGGHFYYVTFINDLSKNTSFYFLKKKSDLFKKIEFKLLMENQIGKKIKVLRTDNGGEFCGKEFKKFCK